MAVRIIGLGPGAPSLLTLGSLDALRTIGRAIALLSPTDLSAFLETHGVVIDREIAHDDAALIVRGGTAEIERLVTHICEKYLGEQSAGAGETAIGTIAIGVLGNPLSDFPGLPMLLHLFEQRGIAVEIIPGVPRATLSASMSIPLVPLPPQSAHHSFDDLVEIMARLRMGCPWDKEQTHRTLVPYLIEETYEVVEAIEHGDLNALCDELGDLLLQIVFHSQLGSETGKFTVADVIDALSNKMIRRHPHVFGDAVIEDVDSQWKSWENLKSQEKTGQKRKSRLEGIPKHLGALQRGQRMQEKASRVGFDWPNADGVLEKITEELGELVEELRKLAESRREKQDDPHVREELGDAFFALVNLSRALGIDAETAMREANEKFYTRFGFMEQTAATENTALKDLTLDQLEELWQKAKKQLH